MPRNTRRSLITLALLAGAAVIAALIMLRQAAPKGVAAGQGHTYLVDIDNWRRTERERTVQSPFDFSLAGDLGALPLTVGAWQGQDVPQTNLEVFILLEPEQYLQRLYTRPDGRSLWLSLIGSRKSKSFHAPQICYDADGWTTAVGSEAIPLSAGEIYALRLVASKPITDGGTQTHVALYFYIWSTLPRDNSQGLVFFKVTAPLDGSLEETLAREKAFIAEFFVESRK
jgi:hypothetical protein